MQTTVNNRKNKSQPVLIFFCMWLYCVFPFQRAFQFCQCFCLSVFCPCDSFVRSVLSMCRSLLHMCFCKNIFPYRRSFVKFWVSVACKTVCFALRNGPFHTLKRAVRACQTGRFVLRNCGCRVRKGTFVIIFLVHLKILSVLWYWVGSPQLLLHVYWAA